MEIAYVAGLFDGEGTVGIYKVASTKSDKVYWAARLAIVGTYKPMIEAVYQHFGFGLFTTQKRQAMRRTPRGEFYFGKQGWRWQVTNKPDIRAVLEQIGPYLIEKSEQADIVLQFINKEIDGESASILCKKAKGFYFGATDFDEYAPRQNNGRNAGAYSTTAKLTADDVKNIRSLHQSGMTATEIAKMYNVSKPTTARIINHVTWRNP